MPIANVRDVVENALLLPYAERMEIARRAEALGVPMLEVWGMTESCGASTGVPATYQQLHSGFRWQVPAAFNIAQVCCTRWAARPDATKRVAVYAHSERASGQKHTYSALQKAANRLSHALVAQGVQRGDRVALVMPQSFETAVAYMAVLQLGAADPTALGAESLRWARGSLGAGDWRLRESAALVLGMTCGLAGLPAAMTGQATDEEGQGQVGRQEEGFAMGEPAPAPGSPHVPASSPARALLRLAQAAPATLWATALFALFDTVVLSLLPLYLQSHGFSTAVALTSASVVLLGDVVMEVPVGWWADRWGVRRVQAGCAAVMALCVALLPMGAQAFALGWRSTLAVELGMRDSAIASRNAFPS